MANVVLARIASILQKDGRPLDQNELTIAAIAYDAAQNEISQKKTFDADLPAGFDAKFMEVVRITERVLDTFKLSEKARKDFLNSFKHWSAHCKNTIVILRELAEEMKSGRCDLTILRFFSAIAGAGAGLAMLWNPFAFIFSGLANVLIFGATAEEIRIVKILLQKARTLIVEEQARFSLMAQWFYCPEGLHEAIYSLIDYDTFKKMSQEAQKFHEVTKEKEDEMIKIEFDRFLKYCMEQMAKDPKITEIYGKELAPAVMTFVFVICLMKDVNRITLDCSVMTSKLAVDLLSGLNLGLLGVGLLGNLAADGSAFALCRYAGGAIAQWFNVAIDLLIAAVSFYELYHQADPVRVTKIEEAADEFEKILFFVETVYKETKKYNCD